MIRLVRRKTRQIRIGNVAVGGGLDGSEPAPVSIQTMAKADPLDVDTIVQQLSAAKEAGCDIARVAVPDFSAIRTIATIRERSGLPIVADVHFDHRLAVEAAQAGADGLRVNPGNLGGPSALKAVVEAAGRAQIPIRVGVNAGSLPKTGGQPTRATAEVLVRTAQEMIAPIEAIGFSEIKVSLKAFDVGLTVEANGLFASQSDLPLHLGVTEAGPPLAGAVRSTAALSLLLAGQIGDTVRISLTAPPVDEVRAARFLLRALGLRRGPVVVACPTCGRSGADLAPVAERIEGLVESLDLDVVVAVMGCEVNGPGEARAADLGVAFGPAGEGLLFESGQIVGKHANQDLERVLVERLERKKEEDRHGQ